MTNTYKGSVLRSDPDRSVLMSHTSVCPETRIFPGHELKYGTMVVKFLEFSKIWMRNWRVLSSLWRDLTKERRESGVVIKIEREETVRAVTLYPNEWWRVCQFVYVHTKIRDFTCRGLLPSQHRTVRRNGGSSSVTWRMTASGVEFIILIKSSNICFGARQSFCSTEEKVISVSVLSWL